MEALAIAETEVKEVLVLAIGDQVYNEDTQEQGEVIDKWTQDPVTVKTWDKKGNIYINHWKREDIQKFKSEKQ